MEAPTCALMEMLPMILIRAGGLPFSAWQSTMSGESLETISSDEVATAVQRVQHSFDQALAEISPSDFRTGIYNARKAFFQKSKMPSSQLLESINARHSEPALAALGQQLALWQSIIDRQPRLEERYSHRLEKEWEGIQQVARTPWIRQALLFASHDLLRQLPAFCAKEVKDFDKKDRQTARSIVQYLSRSIFKTSPLGRFTTVQLWRLDQEQQQDFLDEKIAITPSVAMLPALYEVLLREPAFFQSLDILLNPCIPGNYSEGDVLTWLYFDGEQEAFQRLDNHPVAALMVRYLLDHDRQASYSTLMTWLSDTVAASKDQLESLLQELVAVGLLEWQLPEKGLSPSWCSNLCQYLSFLPSAPVLTEAAFLLQSLRVSARAMSFQSVEEACATQEGAKQQLEDFMRQFNGVAPPIPVEQIFFQDVEKSQVNQCSETALRQVASDLAACWNRNDIQVLPELPSRLVHYTNGRLDVGETVDFQAFCADFMNSDASSTPCVAKRYQGKIGAMIQVFRDRGQYRAVVNALFPGGGKLFARWLHLFPADFRDAVEAWNDPDTVLFPWQGWSNANFQSLTTGATLSVPDGRVMGNTRYKKLFLSDLGVRSGSDGPELVEKSTGKRVIMKDLGLEAPSSRPPVMQILWHLGVPFVSASSLIPTQEWESTPSGVKKRPRMEYESLVLARAAWECPLALFQQPHAPNQNAAARYFYLKQWLIELGVPRYFFARPTGARQKPQFYDQESPVSMQLFDKMLLSGSTTATHIWLEEMLPTPDQWVLGAGEGYVGEMIVEYLSI